MPNGLFFAIFLALWILPVIAGVVVAKRKNRSPHWFWLGIWPGVGMWVLIIMLVLKPLKKCPNCGKKVQQDAKVCPFCARPYAEAQKSEEELKAEKKQSRKRTAITVGVVLLVIVALASVVSVSVFSSFTNSEPYKHSLELISENAEARSYLGEDFKRKGLVSGSISFNGDASGKAALSYKLKGKNGISRVYVAAVKENGVWNYKKLVFYKTPGSSETIDLLEKSGE